MLPGVIIPPQEPQLQLDEISSPINPQIFDFCDSELFQETLQNSEVTSGSNCCYEENSSYATNLSIPPELDKLGSYQDNNDTSKNTARAPANTATTSTTTTGATTTNNSSSLSMIFDSQEDIDNDISASIDFSSSPQFSVPQLLANQPGQFVFSSGPQILLTDVVIDGLSSQFPVDPVAAPVGGPPFAGVFEEDCLSSVPSYPPLNPSSPCSFLGPAMATYMPAAGTMNPGLSAESCGIFTGSILMGPELQQQELEYQAGNNGGIYCPDAIHRVFNPGDLQALSESQQLVGRAPSAPLASEISSLDDSTFNKVGKLSVEQRKEKIHRYMKKRNERNFCKKIKYACRKTLADSRPRVRGRFAKNDEFGDTPRQACGNHEDEDDDEVVVKEEDDMIDSSDIFAHISGVNSFKCNYPIQSWI